MNILIKGFIQKITEKFEIPREMMISPVTEFQDIDGWDSMTALGIMAMIDEEYDIQIKGEDLESPRTIEDLFLKLQKIIKN